ncbi:DUF1194 domain-containing protein [Azospirillum halopraeferens]|uniref:DUF1194 domain-containing protein n=1 Tax=Azospirillum halopraeferens TaxID=34010 RepID=UPI00041DA8DF|nr:DUF1194 domain-containing protein [Azospirillum halopraeferens]
MLLRSAVLALVFLFLPAWTAVADTPRRAAPAPTVALELVMLVDGSASISTGALEFQLRGHAAAFRDPDVVAAITAGGGVAVTLAAFAGPNSLKVLVPWRVAADAAGAEAFAAAIMTAPRTFKGGSTAIGSAIDAAVVLFDRSTARAARKAIDIVSNGFSNAGIDPAEARDRAVERDITINALAILDEYAWLEEYYRESVIGGFNAFVLTAMDRESFVDALRRKLILEIAGREPDTRVADLVDYSQRATGN